MVNPLEYGDAKAYSIEELVDIYYKLRDPNHLQKLSMPERMEKASTIIDQSRREGFYFYRRPLANSKPMTQAGGLAAEGQRSMINLASNDYLNYTQHPEVIKAAQGALHEFGAGSGSVPMLSGTLTIHKQLEERLAAFLGYEGCLTFSSGFAANYGVLAALLQPGDAVILDTLVHASIIDGCVHAKKLFFSHNDPQSLDRALTKARHANNKLVVVDGVYSMDGDIVKFKEIKDVARSHDAYLMVDDAHGIGVMGEKGQGVQHYLGEIAEADLVTGSFGKALAGIGGYVCSSKKWIQYFELMSRTFVFSSSLPPAIAAGVIKELDLLEGGEPALGRLWENTRFFREGLQAAGYDLGITETPIIPVFIRDEKKALELCGKLHGAGIFVNPIVYPVVSKRNTRLRVSLTANLSRSMLSYCLDKFDSFGKQLQIT
jgi:glycine C-acetyltransferase